MTPKKYTLTEWMEESAAVRVKLLAGGSKPGLARFGAARAHRGQDRHGDHAGYAGRRSALLAHRRNVGLRADCGRARQGDVPGHAAAQALQPTGHGAWRLVRRAARFGGRLRGAHLDAGGPGYTTAELGINIVRAASQETGPLRVIGTVIHCGKQLATAKGRIVGPNGRLYADATTCLVFDLPAR